MDEHPIPTRWLDYDLLGHVTHTAIVNFFDEARDAFLALRTGPFDQWFTVIVRTEIDYMHEIPRPTPEVLVRTNVLEVGRTSVTFHQELVANDTLCAAAQTTIVLWDADLRASKEINAADRELLVGGGGPQTTAG